MSKKKALNKLSKKIHEKRKKPYGEDCPSCKGVVEYWNEDYYGECIKCGFAICRPISESPY